MNRKIIAVLLVLVIASASAFASIIQIGAYAEPTGWHMDEALEYDYTDVGSYTFGGEARVNLAFLQAGITAGMPTSFDNLNGMLQASLISGPKVANVTRLKRTSSSSRRRSLMHHSTSGRAST